MEANFVDRSKADYDALLASQKPKPVAPAPKPIKPQPSLACKQCGGTMTHYQKTSGNALGLVLALFFFVVGLGLTFTIIGAIIGVPMMIAALFIGGKKEKFWRCQNCGSILPRA